MTEELLKEILSTLKDIKLLLKKNNSPPTTEDRIREFELRAEQKRKKYAKNQ